ncbi:MAG: hypothetical protein HC836_34690 [Richelia sp. RM2_1_2]|nr:hypothetical protein [Richelia sp. RM2_1_2]
METVNAELLVSISNAINIAHGRIENGAELHIAMKWLNEEIEEMLDKVWVYEKNEIES